MASRAQPSFSARSHLVCWTSAARHGQTVLTEGSMIIDGFTNLKGLGEPEVLHAAYLHARGAYLQERTGDLGPFRPPLCGQAPTINHSQGW